MQLTRYVNKAQRLVKKGPQFLIFRISEAWDNYNRLNGYISEEDKFFLGLRYSEFLVVDEGYIKDKDYICADNRRLTILECLGVSPEYIRVELYKMTGLS